MESWREREIKRKGGLASEGKRIQRSIGWNYEIRFQVIFTYIYFKKYPTRLVGSWLTRSENDFGSTDNTDISTLAFFLELWFRLAVKP